MPHEPLSTLALALAVGMAAYLLAGRLRIPAIVPLLLLGAAAGPKGLGIVHPEAIGRPELRAFVLGAVLIILFEGSLSLRLSAIREHGRPITRLITLGALVTWVGAAIAARLVLGLGWRTSALIGATLIVTGPTVVIPLLRSVRPVASVREILRWEGILIDPIGAIAAIVCFEFLESGALAGHEASLGQAVGDYLFRSTVGIAAGAVCAIVIDRALRRPTLVSKELATPFALGAVLLSSIGAEHLAHESSLFAAPVAGVILAGMRPPRLEEIERFQGELTYVLLAVLFVVLAADVDPARIVRLGPSGLLFLLALQGVRTISVFAATAFTGLTLREKLFASWLAPRGIVAASVASVFGGELSRLGVPDADAIVPVTFLVIVGTVTIQGLGAPLVARWLDVLAPPRSDVVIAGVTPFGVALARALKEVGVTTWLIDRSEQKVLEAERAGVAAIAGDVLAPASYADVDLEQAGAYLAATTSDKVNGLAMRLAAEILGEGAVLQLPSGEQSLDMAQEASAAMRHPLAFGERFTLAALNDALRDGARMVVRRVDEPMSAADLRSRYRTDFRPLVCIEQRTRRPSFVRATGVKLPAGSMVGIEDLPRRLLAAEQRARNVPAAAPGSGRLPKTTPPA